MTAGFLERAGDAFDKEPALALGANGPSISFRELVDACNEAADFGAGFSAPHGREASAGDPISGGGGRPLATWSENSLKHVFLLLGHLNREGIIAPISFRLPEAPARACAARIGAGAFWKGTGAESITNPLDPPPVRGPSTILFTSGSSGAPKAVVHTLEAHFASARASRTRIPLQPGDRWFVNLPLWHISGLAILFRCIEAGACAVLPDLMDKNVLPPTLTHISAVPTQLARWLPRPPPPALKALLLGGGPASSDLVAAAISAGWPVHLTYGMTETASQVSTSSRLLSPPGSVHAGHALPGWEIRHGFNGRIELRGPSLPATILSDSEGWVQAVDADGWMRTGDLGTTGNDGLLRILGRADRMFISGGENIYPEAIEAVIGAIPGIKRCAVTSIPDPVFGARPVAFIAGTFNPEFLRSEIASRLEKFAIPDHFLPWPEDLDPEIPKIPYRELESRARALENRLEIFPRLYDEK